MITGTGFLAAPDTSVTFGRALATDVMVIDNTSLTCVTPSAAALGPVDVTVANEMGFDTLAEGFLYGFVRSIQ